MSSRRGNAAGRGRGASTQERTSPAASEAASNASYDRLFSMMEQLVARFDTLEARVSAIDNRLDTIEDKLETRSNHDHDDDYVRDLVRRELTAQPTPSVEPTAEQAARAEQATRANRPTHTREASVRDIGYFDPQDDAQEAVYTKGDKHELVYTDVTLFSQKLTRIAGRKALYGDTIVACLRGKALSWFNGASSALQDALYDGSVDRWIQEITDQFGLRRQSALDNLLSTRYTVNDAKGNQAELVKYLDRIQRYCRALQYDTKQQRDYVWRNMHTEIRAQFLDSQDLEIDQLRTRFDERQQMIWALFKFKGPPMPSTQRKQIEYQSSKPGPLRAFHASADQSYSSERAMVPTGRSRPPAGWINESEAKARYGDQVFAGMAIVETEGSDEDNAIEDAGPQLH